MSEKNMIDDFNIAIEQANSALLSRDYEFAEKLLISQLKKTDSGNTDEVTALKSLLGKIYIRSNDMQKALTIYTELNALKPNDIEIENSIGLIYRRLKLFNESIAVLEKAKSLDKKNGATLYNLGKTYKQKGDYKNAENCFNEVLEIKPDYPFAYNHLGHIYFLCKDYNKAINIYKTGLHIDPNNPFLNFNIAEIYKLKKMYIEAVLSYQTALKIKPNWCEALFGLSNCYIQLNDLQKAINTYKTVIGIKDENEKDFSKLANLYEMKNEKTEAETYYKKALMINKYFLPAIFGYSKLLKSQTRYSEAFTVLLNGIEKNKHNKHLLLDMAELALILENYTKVKEIVNTLSILYKNDFDVLKLQGKFFSVLGEIKKAEQIFEHLLQISPDEMSLKLELADLYFNNGEFKEASQLLIKYLDEKPQDNIARLKLGNAYAEMQQYDNAKTEYKKIIKNDKKNTQALEAILELNKKLGNTEKAVQVAADMIQIESENDSGVNTESLSNSIKLYEAAVSDYGNDSALNKNISMLHNKGEEIDLSPKENESINTALKTIEISQTSETDEELMLDETVEDIPSLEMPFDDLIELSGEDLTEEDEDKKIDDMVLFDSPIEDTPGNSDYDDKELNLNLPDEKNHGGMQQEEFQLPYTGENKSTGNVRSEMSEPQTDNSGLDKYSYMEIEGEKTDELELSNKISVESKKTEESFAESALAQKSLEKNPVSHAQSVHDGFDLQKDARIQQAISSLNKTVESLDSMAGKLADKIERLEENKHNPSLLNNDTENISDVEKNENSHFQTNSTEENAEKKDVSKIGIKKLIPHKIKDSPDFENELKIIDGSEIIRLFLYLNDLMKNLPKENLKHFLISNERIQMKYIIDKLSGEIGLKNRIMLMNLKTSLDKTIKPKNVTEKHLKNTLGYLRLVASQLPDKGFAEACAEKLNNLIENLK